MSFIKESNNNFEDIAEQLIFLSGVIFLFLGFSGLLMSVFYPKMYKDEVLQFATSFVYSYMAILGIFLILYHNKIIVREYRI